MRSFNFASFASALLLLTKTYTVTAAPVSVSSHIEILRISGVEEREIERQLNPNHALASAHDSTIPRTATPFTAPQQFILSALSSPSYSKSAEDTEFEHAIDGYSTAKLSPDDPTPASASQGPWAFEDIWEEATEGDGSLGAFERVKQWMKRRAGGDDEPIIVTGRLGSLKIRGRR